MGTRRNLSRWHRACFSSGHWCSSMSKWRASSRLLAFVVVVFLTGPDVFAETVPPDAGSTPEGLHLVQSREVVHYTGAVPGSSIRARGAKIAGAAPLAAVRQGVTDHAHYQ